MCGDSAEHLPLLDVIGYTLDGHVEHGTNIFVADICEYFDLGGQKSGYYQALLRERASAKTKRRPVARGSASSDARPAAGRSCGNWRAHEACWGGAGAVPNASQGR